jgi:hypothetical protein
MSKVEIVRDLDPDAFHRRVLELEAEGYVVRPGTYNITAEVNPADGIISHVYSVEMNWTEHGGRCLTKLEY